MSAQEDVLYNLIRQKRLLDTFGNGGLDNQPMPEDKPALTIAVKHSLDDGSSDKPSIASQGSGPYDTSSSGDTVVPPSPNKHPLTDAYMKSLESAPEYQEPSTTRKVLGNIAGAFGGILSRGSLADRIKSGGTVRDSIEQGPNNDAMKSYTAKTGKDKILSDLELANNKSDLADRTEESKADKQSAEAAHYRQVTQGLPESFAESEQAKIDEEKAKLAVTAGKNYEAKLKDGTTVSVHEDPNGTMHKVDPTKIGGLGDLITWDAIDKRSQPNSSIKQDAEPKDAFQLWRVQNPDKPVESWLNEQKKSVQTEYQDFKDGYTKKHPNASGDEVAAAYSNATTKAPQALMISNGRAINVKPGTPVPENAQTPSGVNQENTETSTTRTMRESAPKVSFLANKVDKEIDKQVSSLGPAAGRWSEFWTGKVGAPNPEFSKLRTDAMLLKTALMRMHLGARGGQSMYEHFNSLLDTAGQDPNNLKAALSEIKDYADEVAKQPGSSRDTLPGGISLDDINAEIARRKGGK